MVFLRKDHIVSTMFEKLLQGPPASRVRRGDSEAERGELLSVSIDGSLDSLPREAVRAAERSGGLGWWESLAEGDTAPGGRGGTRLPGFTYPDSSRRMPAKAIRYDALLELLKDVANDTFSTRASDMQLSQSARNEPPSSPGLAVSPGAPDGVAVSALIRDQASVSADAHHDA